MPAAPRKKGVATKVFFKVMGIPQNMRDRKTPKQKKINKELLNEEMIYGQQ
jgi:hypothetical protein